MKSAAASPEKPTNKKSRRECHVCEIKERQAYYKNFPATRGSRRQTRKIKIGWWWIVLIFLVLFCSVVQQITRSFYLNSFDSSFSKDETENYNHHRLLRLQGMVPDQLLGLSTTKNAQIDSRENEAIRKTEDLSAIRLFVSGDATRSIPTSPRESETKTNDDTSLQQQHIYDHLGRRAVDKNEKRDQERAQLRAKTQQSSRPVHTLFTDPIKRAVTHQKNNDTMDHQHRHPSTGLTTSTSSTAAVVAINVSTPFSFIIHNNSSATTSTIASVENNHTESNISSFSPSTMTDTKSRIYPLVNATQSGAISKQPFSGAWLHTKPFKLSIRKFRMEDNAGLLQTNKSSNITVGIQPTNPLCELCRQVVQRPKPLNVSYVPAIVTASMQRTALHLGATFPNGTTLGYVHDETALRRQPPPFNYSGVRLTQACTLRDDTFAMIQGKIRVVSEADLEQQRKELRARGVPLQRTRRETLFCMVYSTDVGHSKLQRIRETWGQKCDGFLVASNRTDPSMDAVNITHKFEETYGNMWQKVRTMWSYVYDHYYENYDWFHIGGDDLYLIVDNLRYYLESEEIKTAANGGIFLPSDNETKQVPLYLGCRHNRKGIPNDLYNAGGSGYTLNKAALKTLVLNGLPRYFQNERTSTEDVVIAWVFRRLGVVPYPTKDNTGGERYNPLSPGTHYRYRMTNHKRDWYRKYALDLQFGLNHSATHSVAFHYIRSDDMYRLHALFYGLCSKDALKKNVSATSNTAALVNWSFQIHRAM